MKKVLFSVALVMASCVAFGQTKAVKEAKRQADAKKFAEAEQLINQALENAETKDDANTWNVAGYVQQKINEEENTKAYLKQPFDTVKMYNSTYKMFEFFNKCDELEQIPNEKGKVKIRYRKANAATMQQNRPNLINGGVLYFNNGNDAEAYKYFSMYIDSAEYPMLKEANIAATDSMMPTIAYYTALAATKMAQEADQNNNKDAAKASYQNVLKYADLASNDKENGKFALGFKAGAYKALGDTAQWVATLQDGVQRFPAHSYFFGNYIDYCSNAGKYAEAVKFADDMIAKNGNSDFYQYVKGYLYQNMKEYDKAIAAYKQAIELKPDYVEAYSNLGLCYCQQAIEFGEKAVSDIDDPKYQEEQAKIKKFYEDARPYYEKARQLAPDKKDLWGNGLYTIYYKLNMGEEFKEIEKLMQM